MSEQDKVEIVVKETKKIPIDKIQMSNLQARQSGVSKGLEIFAEQIRKIGLIQPVVVYEIDGGMYELIVGQRRFLAHKDVLKWTEIMAMVIEKPASDMMSTTISWLENEARQKMTFKDITMCIPRVENFTNKDFVYKTLCKINAGKIKKIVEKPLKNEKNYKRILIQMTINQNNQNGAYILDRFSKGENIKVVYENQEYWRVVSSY